jgi:hypothetical protein
MDPLRADLSALVAYRVAVNPMTRLVLVDAEISSETLRADTLRVDYSFCAAVAVKPPDAAFILSCYDGDRHLKVRVGNVETSEGRRQVSGYVVRADTDVASLLRRSLAAVGRTADTAVAAFTDGCPDLRSILAEAAVTERPIADRFHIALRLQHAKLAAGGLSTGEPARIRVKPAIVAEFELLRWRIWNCKAKSARISLERVRKAMHPFRGERGHRRMGVPSRKLWHALQEGPRPRLQTLQLRLATSRRPTRR